MLYYLLMFYVLGGGVFLAIGWFWSEISFDLNAKRTMARATLFFPLWPIMFLILFCYGIFKFFIMLIKTAEFGVKNGRQDQEESKKNPKGK